MPMMNLAASTFEEFIKPEFVSEISDLLQYRDTNKVSDSLLIRKYPRVNDLEIRFEHDVLNAYHEIEQLLSLASPLLHEQIRTQVQSDFEDLKKSIQVKNLKDNLSKFNRTETKTVIFRGGKVDKKASDKIPNPTIEHLLADRSLFTSYQTYLEELLNRFEFELRFFIESGFETILTSEKHIGNPLSRGSNDKTSSLSDDDLEGYILDKVRFIEICELLTHPRVLGNGKSMILLLKTESGYKWIGRKRKGIGIDRLGALLRRLLELGILAIPIGKKEKVARATLDHFKIERSNSTAGTLAKAIENTGGEDNLFFKALIPQ